MAWNIPSARQIAEAIAGTLEAAFLAIKPDLDPVELSRSLRSRKGNAAQYIRAVSLELRSLHDHLAWWGRQYFVDSAEEEFVYRHASIWGIAQREAKKAVGTVTIEGVPGTVLPSGIEIAAGDATAYVTTSGGTIGIGGAVTVSAEAAIAGSSGNLEAGIRLVTIAPYPEITRITVATAFRGGTDEMSPEELQQATLQRIRQPPHGGAFFDYPVWVAQVASVAAVKPIGDWIGPGSVGVVVVMRDDDGTARAPTTPELTAIGDHLETVRPVTARVIPLAGVLTPVPLTIRLRPDTVLIRAAVTEAFARYIATLGDEEDEENDSPIGALIEPSRISEAISAASGEYAHDLLVPAAPYSLDPTHYAVAGTITFEDP